MWCGVLHFNFILLINFKILAELTSTVVLVLQVYEGHSVVVNKMYDLNRTGTSVIRSLCFLGPI